MSQPTEPAPTDLTARLRRCTVTTAEEAAVTLLTTGAPAVVAEAWRAGIITLTPGGSAVIDWVRISQTWRWAPRFVWPAGEQQVLAVAESLVLGSSAVNLGSALQGLTGVQIGAVLGAVRAVATAHAAPTPPPSRSTRPADRAAWAILDHTDRDQVAGGGEY